MLSQADYTLLKTCLPFFRDLLPHQKNLLEQNSSSTTFIKDQIIHSGDTNCIGVFYIKHGQIRAYITSEEGREITLFRLSAGDICLFSASCALHSLEFDICVAAEVNCDVILINAATYAKLTSENKNVELFSYKQVMHYFADVMWAFQQILFTSFDKRLAYFLIEERDSNNQIHMTQEEIAKHLGSAREVVSRMLKYFTTEGYVSLFRGGITILKPEELKKLYS